MRRQCNSINIHDPHRFSGTKLCAYCCLHSRGKLLYTGDILWGGELSVLLYRGSGTSRTASEGATPGKTLPLLDYNAHHFLLRQSIPTLKEFRRGTLDEFIRLSVPIDRLDRVCVEGPSERQ